jgi:hypothetical protein
MPGVPPFESMLLARWGAGTSTRVDAGNHGCSRTNLEHDRNTLKYLTNYLTIILLCPL